ncbi:MAG: DUF4267 domain-containing protein [bacterium]|nr:DUF4267 domain-containing protein [bacterium]
MVSQALADTTFLLCTLAAIGLGAIGVLALLAPERLARSYGVPVTERAALAFVRATGVRDILIGAIVAGATYLHDALTLAALAVIGFVLSVADFTIAFSFERRFRTEQLAHVGGAVGFAVLFALLSLMLRR